MTAKPPRGEEADVIPDELRRISLGVLLNHCDGHINACVNSTDHCMDFLLFFFFLPYEPHILGLFCSGGLVNMAFQCYATQNPKL